MNCALPVGLQRLGDTLAGMRDPFLVRYYILVDNFSIYSVLSFYPFIVLLCLCLSFSNKILLLSNRSNLSTISRHLLKIIKQKLLYFLCELDTVTSCYIYCCLQSIFLIKIACAKERVASYIYSGHRYSSPITSSHAWLPVSLNYLLTFSCLIGCL